MKANIPLGRAGSAYGTTCDGKYLIVAGGEGNNTAYSNVEAFDGETWVSWDSLHIGRHGSGLAIDCTINSTCQNQMYIASGASSQGGGSEILSVEAYFPNGLLTTCS